MTHLAMLDVDDERNSATWGPQVSETSTESWEAAAANAVQTASKSLRDLRVAEVTKLDMTVKNGKVEANRARVSLSFKFEGK